MKPSKKRLLLLEKIIRQPFYDSVSGKKDYYRFYNDERALCIRMEGEGLVRRLDTHANTFYLTPKGRILFEEVMCT